MITADELVKECLRRMQSVAELSGKAVQAYNEEQLFNSIKVLALPAVGVVYGGMRSGGEPGVSDKAGVSGIAVMNFIVIATSAPLGNDGESQTYALGVLDSLRHEFLDTVSVTGHKWKFVSEVLVGAEGRRAIWNQTWTTPVQFVRKRP